MWPFSRSSILPTMYNFLKRFSISQVWGGFKSQYVWIGSMVSRSFIWSFKVLLIGVQFDHLLLDLLKRRPRWKVWVNIQDLVIHRKGKLHWIYPTINNDMKWALWFLLRLLSHVNVCCMAMCVDARWGEERYKDGHKNFSGKLSFSGYRIDELIYPFQICLIDGLSNMVVLMCVNALLPHTLNIWCKSILSCH